MGRKWLGLFLNRWNSELIVSKEEKMGTGRRSGFDEDARCRWFELLNRVMINENLISRPHAIYNCSQSGFDRRTASEMKIVSTKETLSRKTSQNVSFQVSCISSIIKQIFFLEQLMKLAPPIS